MSNEDIMVLLLTGFTFGFCVSGIIANIIIMVCG